MKRVLITGYNGFVGENLIEKLETVDEYSLIRFGRQENDQQLEQYVDAADFIFHLAGINRPPDEKEFYEGNFVLTKKIVDFLIKNNKKTSVVFSSSIQAELNNPYGISKAMAEKELIRYRNVTGASIFLYRLPNLFGRGVRPNYNSVVATFLYNIKYDKEIKINDPDKELTLVYIDDLLDEFVKVLEGKRESRVGFYSISKTYQITLRELAECIYEIKADHKCDLDIYEPLLKTYLTY